MTRKRKRKTVWAMKPENCEISCDLCGGDHITWSEWEGKIWCYRCQKDTKGHGGIFDGPIPIRVCKMIGLSFDKISLKTGKLLKMRIKGNKIFWR